MEILVTGATGKVGSRLIKRLAQRGDRVRALVRDATRAANLREDRIELVEGDLLAADSLPAAVRGVDAVVHCAAFFRGATPEQAHAVNDLGTQHLALDGLDVHILPLPFVYGDGDAHIAEAVPMMRGFPPTQRLSIGHHADVAQAVALVLDAASPAHRIYNVVDDEAPELATLFASVGAPPPDGSDAERARAFDTPLDGRRTREDLGFKPKFPRLADAIGAGA